MNNESKVIEVYKPSESKESQMRNHGNVKKNVEKRLKHNRRDEVQIDDSLVEFKQELIQMLSGFESMWDGHLVPINFAKHRGKVSPADAKLVHSAPYQPGPEAREFDKNEIDRLLSKGFIERDQTVWAASIVLAPKKNGFLCF